MEVAIWLILLLVAVVIVVGAIIAIVAVSTKKETTESVSVGEGSYFDGNTWQLIGYRILSSLVNTITLGIAYPWMLCMVQRWEVKHTVIHGRRLKFNGHGHQLIGKYLLWVFLTIITFGIYGIWLGLGMKKWVVKHTVYADETKTVDSYFSGGAGGYLGIHILSFILTLFTFGIGKAWADKMILKWESKHAHIGGSPLEFNGTGGQLFVKYLLLVLLTPLTLGIYALFFTVIYKKWEVKHTEAVYQTPEIQAKAKAHELTAVQDFAKYRIAANDQEIAAMKSGYTGKEDNGTLEQMAEDGNPFAAYHLAKKLKGENALYEEKALELLQKAADGKVHSALLDLAKQLPAEQKVSMLIESAQCGNAEASWLLTTEYKNANNLPQAAYWFKVALEWGVADATARTTEYDELVKNIALQLSENRVMPQQSKALPIVLVIVGAILLAVVAFSVMTIFGLRHSGKHAQNEHPVGLDTEVENSKAIKVGDYVYFGTYEQDNNISNGKEDIEWLVLDIQGDSVLVISKYALDCQPYNEELTDVTWETCSLRKWLNNTFINTAFSNEEQEIIQTTTVSADKNSNYSTNPGNATQDRVFLLSVNEVYNYFESNDERKCGTTEYAEAQNVYTSDSHSADGKATCYWWLRSPGYSQDIAARVGIDGHIVNVGDGVDNDRYAVRPALRITLQGNEVLEGNRINLSDMSQTDAPPNDNTVEGTSTTEPAVNLASSIVGDWVYYDMLTNMTTGDDILEVWNFTFNSDGTYSYVHNECLVSTEGNIYYGGKCWSAMLGSGTDGTYTVNGNELTVQYYEYDYSTIPSSTKFDIELRDSSLSMYCDGWGRTRDFERK